MTLSLFFNRNRWVWSFLGAAFVWIAIIWIAGIHGAFETLSVGLLFATFLVIVGLGQMLVITAGMGNIDLSIPGVMTLAGYIAMGMMHAENGNICLGLLLGVLIGVITGGVNITLIRLLRIPPMVTTLATGFILQSFSTAYSSQTHAQPPSLLYEFTSHRVFGFSAMTILFIFITIFVIVWCHRTIGGRTLLALGQNRRAAFLTGLAVTRTEIMIYLASGILAALAGILLAADSGGASLDMANNYLLMSVAVVVLGGTSVAGGTAVPSGLWGAALLLGLVVTMLDLLHVSQGIRFIVTGFIIIAVLALARED